MSGKSNRSPALPTVQEIEQGGEWVSVRNNPFGFASDLLCAWRKHGCAHVRGRRIGAQQFTVLVPGQRGARRIWFYHRRTLAEIARGFEGRSRKGRAPFGRYPQHWTKQETKREWAEYERFTDAQGREWVAPRIALAQLDTKHNQLWQWRRFGCPYLGGRRLSVRIRAGGFGRRSTFYSEAELDEVKRNRDQLGQAPDGGNLVTLDEGARLTGLHKGTLYLMRKRGQLTSANVLLRGKDGKAYWRRALLRSELADLAARRAASVPPERMTVRQAALRLQVSKTCLRAWMDVCPYLGRPLDCVEGTVPGRRGHRRGLLVLRAEVEEIRAILRADSPPEHRDAAGTWLPAKRAAQLFGVTPSVIQNHRLHGRVEAKRIKTRDRWGHRGWRWVYLEASLQALLASCGEAESQRLQEDRPPVQPAVESRTAPRESTAVPLPQTAYPVYIVQPAGQPVPVAFVPAPGTATARLTIDVAAGSATLDGVTYKDLNRDALRVLEILRDRPGEYVSSPLLASLLPAARHEKTVRRWLETLPAPLALLVESKTGAGRRLRLPETTCP